MKYQYMKLYEAYIRQERVSFGTENVPSLGNMSFAWNNSRGKQSRGSTGI